MSDSKKEMFENIRNKTRKSAERHKSSIDNTKLNGKETANNRKMKGIERKKTNKVTEASQSILNPLCASICKPISIHLTRLKYDELLCYEQKQLKVKRRALWKRTIPGPKRKKSVEAIADLKKRKSSLHHRRNNTEPQDVKENSEIDLQCKVALKRKSQSSSDIVLKKIARKDECAKEVPSPIINFNEYQNAQKFKRKEQGNKSQSKTAGARLKSVSKTTRRSITSPSKESDNINIDILIDIPKRTSKHREDKLKASNLQEVLTPNMCNGKELKIRVIKLEHVKDDNEVIKWRITGNATRSKRKTITIRQ